MHVLHFIYAFKGNKNGCGTYIHTKVFAKHEGSFWDIFSTKIHSELSGVRSSDIVLVAQAPY